MASDEHNDAPYQSLKQQLWNQPNALKVLEQLEHDGAPTAMVGGIARQLALGHYGEAQILAAVCTELLRNSAPKIILKRAGNLREIAVSILHDLSWMAGEINQLKAWEAHRAVGFEEWTEFSEDVLGLSGTVVEALQLAREQAADGDLNQFLQAMIKGYVAPAGSQKTPLPAGAPSVPRPSDPQTRISALKARLELAEFHNGELIRANHALKEELIQTRADTYREVQKREALIDKLNRNLDPCVAQPSEAKERKTRHSKLRVIGNNHHP